jgi:hypothetical protein
MSRTQMKSIDKITPENARPPISTTTAATNKACLTAQTTPNTPPGATHRTQVTSALRTFLLCTLLTSFCGCFSTHLPETPIPSHLPRLLRLSEQDIPTTIKYASSTQTVGYQYLLAIPLSRVYAPHLQETLTQRLALHAGINKYQLAFDNPSAIADTRIEVSIKDIRINGFDLLFVRRPTTHLAIQATLYRFGKSSRECTTRQDVSDFKAFAFSEELQAVLETAVDQAAQDIITCLGLSDPALPLPTYSENEMY